MKTFNYDKARLYFKQVLELDPENKNALEMLDFLSGD
jgi:hypothetical protein